MQETLTATGLSALLGAILSFVLAKFPKVSDWWKTVPHKELILVAIFVAAPFAIFGLSCSNAYLGEYGCPVGAFVTARFYIENIVLGLSAFAGSQMAWANGSKNLQKER